MKTAVITGASRGIGLAAALKFAKNGFNVVLNSLHDNENLKNAALACSKAAGGGCLSVPGDVSLKLFADELMRKSYEHFGSIDILVNNAGISYVGLIQDTGEDIWQKVINTNLSSVHYCTRAAIPYMLKNHDGRIINISSVWGRVGASCEAAYSASKGGMDAYTKAAARELAPSGIAVNAIACGCVKTDMLNCYSKEELEDLASEIPAGRLGTPGEIAEAIYHTALMPSYLSGQIISVDGCWT